MKISPAATIDAGSLTKHQTVISILIIGLLFFIFGFVSWVNSILIMGLCGNAILPVVYGYFADMYNVRAAYCVLFPCYLYLVFYAFHGHRARRWVL